MQWPARVQHLLDTMRTECTLWLEEPLQLCLGDFGKRLHAEAEHSRNHLEQQRHLATREYLQAERKAFYNRFIASVDQAFRQMGTEPTKPTALTRPALSLLDPMEHELTAALDQLSARSEARSGPVLVELSYRMAVLIGAPPLEGDALPIGPEALARAFREASRALNLPIEHELMLLQSLESSLMQGLAPLYEQVNQQLQASGILPGLRAFPVPRTRTQHARTDTPSRAPSEPAAAIAPELAADAPIAVLESLRQLLTQGAPSGHARRASDARAPTTDELELALTALQQHVSHVSDRATRELRSAQQLHEELLNQLNAGRPAGAPRTHLSAEQSDKVQLIAMLFEQLASQLQQGGSARSLLGGLQLPVLRVAVTDEQFFEQAEHPARQLLGKVAEVAHDWLDQPGGESDRSLRGKLENVVDRAADGSPTADHYEGLLGEVDQHLSELRRKASVAERRHVEAMEGRERLETARQRAATLMGERFAKSPPRGLLRALLERAWSDVLALTLLRHGEQSDAFAKRLVITDQLLGRLPTGDRQRLQQEVEDGLHQIGMQGEEATQVAERLLGASAAPAAGEAPSTTGLAMKLKQHRRLGESGESAAAADPKPARAPLTRREESIQQRLRSLPFGTWFEFVDATTGKTSQRKLAWFSPVSGRSLFVTRRGQRAEELSLVELTEAISSGKIRERQEEAGGMIERAWHAFTGGLRQPRPPQQGVPT